MFFFNQLFCFQLFEVFVLKNNDYNKTCLAETILNSDIINLIAVYSSEKHSASALCIMYFPMNLTRILWICEYSTCNGSKIQLGTV